MVKFDKREDFFVSLHHVQYEPLEATRVIQLQTENIGKETLAKYFFRSLFIIYSRD